MSAATAAGAGAPVRCAWTGCEVTATRGRLMCSQHRARLPKRLQRSVPATASMLPDSVLAYIRQANEADERAAEREAELRRRQGTLW